MALVMIAKIVFQSKINNNKNNNLQSKNLLAFIIVMY